MSSATAQVYVRGLVAALVMLVALHAAVGTGAVGVLLVFALYIFLSAIELLELGAASRKLKAASEALDAANRMMDVQRDALATSNESLRDAWRMCGELQRIAGEAALDLEAACNVPGVPDVVLADRKAREALEGDASTHAGKAIPMLEAARKRRADADA